MRTRTGLMLAVALCTLSCEEDEQLLGLRSPARAPGADAAVASTSTVQGVEAGVQDSGLPTGHADGSSLDASSEAGTSAQTPRFEGGFPPNEDARATTPTVGQGAPEGTQEVSSGAAEREPDGGVASMATSGAGGAPGVALIGPDSGATNPKPQIPQPTATPGVQANLPPAEGHDGSLPAGWIHQLPAGCSAPEPIDLGSFTQSAVGCPGYLLSASCSLDADDWLCSGLILPDADSPGGVAIDPVAPPPYLPYTVINYRINGVASGTEASNVTLAVTGMGERWPLQSDVCTTEVEGGGTECSRALGCAHLVESDSGPISLWRPSAAGVRCKFEDPNICRCSGASEAIWEAQMTGVEQAELCVVAEEWCNAKPRQMNSASSTCAVRSSGGDAVSCRYESYCGGYSPLPDGGSIRPLWLNTVICEPGDSEAWHCSCERPDGTVRWDTTPTATQDDACSPGVDRCNALESPEALDLPTCVAQSQQSDSLGCHANFDCTWPAAFAETEVVGAARSALECDRTTETSWRCLCGTTGDVWNFEIGDSTWDSCALAVDHCAQRIMSGDVQP